jgi:hypothetical protein
LGKTRENGNRREQKGTKIIYKKGEKKAKIKNNPK